MYFGIALIIIAVLLLFVEMIAEIKRRRIKGIKQYIYNTEDGKSSIMDYYLKSFNHESILDELPSRIGKRFRNNGGGKELAKSLIKQYVDLDDEIKIAINDEIVQMIRGEGQNISLYDEPVNAEGLPVIFGGREYEPYIVKFGNCDYVKESLGANGFYRYIVSSDVYEAFEEDEIIEAFASKGIEVLNGGFRDDDIRKISRRVAKNIGHVSAIIDEIPGFGPAFFGIEPAAKLESIKRETVSDFEYKINVLADFLKVMVAGLIAFAGANAMGSAYGVLGAVVGLGAGAVVGILFLTMIKSKHKMGNVFKALDFFGRKQDRHFTESVKEAIAEELFNFLEVKDYFQKEENLYNSYKREVHPYLFKSPSVPAVLCYEAHKKSDSFSGKIKVAVDQLHEELISICDEIAKKENPINYFGRREMRRRLLGELLLSNRWMIADSLYNKSHIKIIKAYDDKIKRVGKHPYQFKLNTDKLIRELAYKSFTEVESKKEIEEPRYGFYILSTSATLIFIGLSLILF